MIPYDEILLGSWECVEKDILPRHPFSHCQLVAKLPSGVGGPCLGIFSRGQAEDLERVIL